MEEYGRFVVPINHFQDLELRGFRSLARSQTSCIVIHTSIHGEVRFYIANRGS